VSVDAFGDRLRLRCCQNRCSILGLSVAVDRQSGRRVGILLVERLVGDQLSDEGVEVSAVEIEV